MKPLLLPLYLTMCLTIQAQIFPIQVTPQLVPPYSPYLSDYTAPGAQALLIHIRTNDITLSGYAVKLRFTIEGVGIKIRTNPHFNPSPIILEGGGVQQTFQGVDLYEYFDPYALDFSGYSRNEYQKRARLPEGLYHFTVEVLDFNRGTLVSNAGTTMAWIVLNDPPMLNFPTNFSKVPSGDPTNILFSWTPRHSGSPNAAFTTEYTFRLIELWPENRNPYDALLTQVPLFEIATAQHQLLYSTSEPALVHGRKYAWQVQSRDTEGRDLFKNNGRSEVFIFQYGEALAVPQNFQLRWAKPTTLSVRWDPVHHDSEEIKYRLQYRPRLRRENHEWYETRTQFTEKTLYQLQADTDYEMRVRAERITQESAYTETMVFRTLRPEKEEFVCKDPVTPPPSPANTHPVFPLSVNDTLHAGGFRVLVRDVLEVEGKYFGSGVAIVPWLNAAKVRVTFENIRVNDRFWLTAGTVKSVWSAGSSFLLEEHTPLLPGTTPEVGELDITVVEADSLITISGAAIASVTHDEEGNIVVATTDGRQQTLTRGEVYAITDEVGNGYIVDEKGNVAKTTASQASAAAARGNRKYDLQFRFAQGQGLFGFDEQKYEALSAHYQQLNGGQPVAWKALSSATADQLEGSLQSPEIDARRIRFESGSASVTPLSAEQGVVKLSLFGKMSGMEEELVALYSPADSLADNVLGKINLVTYDPVHYKLEIVPVNGAAMPATVTPGIISERLNFIYRQAVVSWQVNLASGIQVDLPAKFDEGQSGLFSNYTADMKKVLNAWGRLQDDTYYLFLIDEPVDPQTLGYMPRNRQAGFVFVAPHQGNGEEFLKTIAHELGHGAFNLKHTFSEYNLPPGTTNNLMDYSPGTALYKYQWDHIHDPGKVVGWFDGEGEGAMDKQEYDLYLLEAQRLLVEGGVERWLQKFREVQSFFSYCDKDGWKSYNGEGIIPHCFWSDRNIPPPLYYTNRDFPFTAGLIDGAYLEAEGIYHLPEIFSDITKLPGKIIYAYTKAYWECRTEKMVLTYAEYEDILEQLSKSEREGGIWNWVKTQWYQYKDQIESIEEYYKDCREADDIRSTLEDLHQLASNWEEIQTLSMGICKQVKLYWNTLEEDDNNGRYLRGKLIIPAATLILPVGAGIASKAEKIKVMFRTLQESSEATWKKTISRLNERRSYFTLTSRLSSKSKSIHENLIRAGYNGTAKEGEILYRDAKGTLVAKLSNDALSIKIPDHHGAWAQQSNTAQATEAFRNLMNNDVPLYKVGTLSRSTGPEAQYWSMENPMDVKDVRIFAAKYGIPEANVKDGDLFVEIAKPKPGIPIISRESPGFGDNPGGYIEIVVPVGGVNLESFHVIKLK